LIHFDTHRPLGVQIKVVYGEPSEVLNLMGGHTAYVERTNLTSRQMNGRLVRKTLLYSKQVAALKAAGQSRRAAPDAPRTSPTSGHSRPT
jgi:hypothetical protein